MAPIDPLEGNLVPENSTKTYPQMKTPSNAIFTKPSPAPEIDDPFEPADPSLLVTTGRIGELKARILIDDGSEVNYINESFCKRNGIALKNSDYTAKMANKTPQGLKSTVSPLQLSIGGYTKSMRFASIPLNYDVILGKKWAFQHKAVIDTYSNEVTFQNKGETHRVVATDPLNLHFVSANVILSHLKKSLPLCAVMIREIPVPRKEAPEMKESQVSSSMQKLLQKYSDVFPEKLPKGLPPKRSHDFHIELKEGSTPQKKGLYHMSPAELSELKT